MVPFHVALVACADCTARRAAIDPAKMRADLRVRVVFIGMEFARVGFIMMEFVLGEAWRRVFIGRRCLMGRGFAGFVGGDGRESGAGNIYCGG